MAMAKKKALKTRRAPAGELQPGGPGWDSFVAEVEAKIPREKLDELKERARKADEITAEFYQAAANLDKRLRRREKWARLILQRAGIDPDSAASGPEAIVALSVLDKWPTDGQLSRQGFALTLLESFALARKKARGREDLLRKNLALLSIGALIAEWEARHPSQKGSFAGDIGKRLQELELESAQRAEQRANARVDAVRTRREKAQKKMATLDKAIVDLFTNGSGASMTNDAIANFLSSRKDYGYSRQSLLRHVNSIAARLRAQNG